MRALLALCLAAVAPAALAQPIDADRPDATESPALVPRGTFQLETGATVSPRSWSVGEALLRVRVLPALEVRATLSRTYTREGGQWSTDAPSLGVKVGLVSSDAGELSLLADASRDAAGAVLLGRRALSARSSVAANVGVGRALRGVKETTALATLSLGTDLGGGIGAFAEVAALDVTFERRPTALADVGLTAALAPRVQADVRVGVEGGRAFTGLGLVVRAPR